MQMPMAMFLKMNLSRHALIKNLFQKCWSSKLSVSLYLASHLLQEFWPENPDGVAFLLCIFSRIPIIWPNKWSRRQQNSSWVALFILFNMIQILRFSNSWLVKTECSLFSIWTTNFPIVISSFFTIKIEFKLTNELCAQLFSTYLLVSCTTKYKSKDTFIRPLNMYLVSNKTSLCTYA